jgi:ornithine cyclodeaminase/alanine dehydrogenase-like protein (mu-crystallin family)
VTLSDGTDNKVIQPTGALTLLSPLGQPTGFIHARNLTAFRTALASSCLLSKRASVKTITAFGAGLQTYWHIRLALLSRGSSVKHVNIIARSFSENTRAILRRFHAVPAATKAREGWSATTFGVLTPGYGEYARLSREQVADADVIFCCVPSREPLFDAELLTSHEGRRKGRLVVAIGGAAPGTRELPRELLLQAVKREGSHLHFHKHAPDGGAIVVDTIEGVLKDVGEIVEAGLKPSQLVE